MTENIFLHCPICSISDNGVMIDKMDAANIDKLFSGLWICTDCLKNMQIKIFRKAIV